MGIVEAYFTQNIVQVRKNFFYDDKIFYFW
jgi:hypothetical protein